MHLQKQAPAGPCETWGRGDADALCSRLQWDLHHGTLAGYPAPRTAKAEAAADDCNSLQIDQLLGGSHRPWALVGAYGNHHKQAADRLGRESQFTPQDCAQLQTLGELISYNASPLQPGYAYLAPGALYARLRQHEDPLKLMRCDPLVQELDALRQRDLQQAMALSPYWQDAQASVYLLPDAPWSHRASGLLNNQLAALEPERANAVLRPMAAGTFQAQVQAGMRRVAHSGEPRRKWIIDHLPATEVDCFITAFSASRWGALRTPVFRAWH